MSTPAANSSLVASALAAVAMLASAAVEATWQDDGRGEASITAAVAALKAFPQRLGPWHARDLPLDESHRQAAGVRGGIVRVYTHETTRSEFLVTLLVGPPGALAVHPPTACFRGQGYEQQGETTAIAFGAGERTQRFHAARFRSPQIHDADGDTDVAWAWSDGGHWMAPANPRLTFATAPVLKKLYVARHDALGEPTLSASDTFRSGEAKDFLHRLLEATGDVAATSEPLQDVDQ